MKFKLIILIISSNDNPIYEEFRKLTRLYLRIYYPIVKYFFIEFKKDLESEVLQKDDYIYVNGEESINPGMIVKTCKAMEFVNDTHDYEFLIRTNLSTLLNMPNILEYISIIPNTNACGGFGFRSFITGTCIVLTKDVVKQIYESYFKYDLLKHNEDIVISAILNKLKIPYFNSNKYYKWGLIIDEQTETNNDYYFITTNGIYNKNIDFPDNILHFRIKNALDRNIDILYFKLLLYKIYHIINDS